MRNLVVWTRGSGQSGTTSAAVAATPPPTRLSRLARRFGLARLRAAGRDAGMTTAEYAVGTVAACGFGGVLFKLLTSDVVVKLLSDILRRALTLSF
jgi:Protein of unknown function (DUF4244)